MNDIVFFPVVTTTTDDLGQIEVAEEFTRQVFCEKKVFLKMNSFKLVKMVLSLNVY